MCGIVGCAIKARNGFTKYTEDAFYQMLFADTLRGDDSTGIVAIQNNTSFGIMKEGYSAPYVIDSMRQDDIGKAMFAKGKAFIGHNRKKTVGAVSDETSHPFVVDDVFAMVHNGTLRNHKELADTVVDSEALAIHLSKVLVKDFDKEKFEESIGKVNGAYAIAAYNQDSDSIYITRNAERPMAYVETSDGWFWASEMGLLYWILGRNSIKFKEEDFKMLAPNTLLTIDLEKNTSTILEYSPKKATVTVSTGKTTGTKKITKPTTNTGTNNRISKSAFKAMKKRYLMERMFFYGDDYVEKNFPLTLLDGETIVNLLGQNDDFMFDHTVVAEYDIDNTPSHVLSFCDALYTGIVTNMEFDKATGWVTFYVSDASAVPKATLTKVYDADAIRASLDAKEKAEAEAARNKLDIYEKTAIALH
jgi:predicted glutamine amidotransferase